MANKEQVGIMTKRFSLQNLSVLLVLALAGCATMENADRAVGYGNYTKAVSYYQTLSDRGILEAQTKLAQILLRPETGVQDFVHARSVLEMAAAQDDARSNYDLAGLYKNGRGTAVDLDKAKGYYQRAYELGFRRSGNALAEIAVAQNDYPAAVKYYSEVEDLETPDIQTEFAVLLLKPDTGVQDVARAVPLLQAAATKNYPRAFFELAALSAAGNGVPKDLGAAESGYKHAFELGYIRSAAQLGRLAEDRADYAGAEAFYRQAITGGYVRAAARIGNLFYKGLGRPVDKVQGLAWYYWARKHGISDIDADIAKREQGLKPVELTTALGLCETLKP